MNTWNDIYDFSEKVLSYILRKKEEEYIQPDQDSPVEKMADKLGNSETLAERLHPPFGNKHLRSFPAFGLQKSYIGCFQRHRHFAIPGTT